MANMIQGVDSLQIRNSYMEMNFSPSQGRSDDEERRKLPFSS